jgi:pimeloyl-ACP methyl ester carboxylesterase
MRPAVDSLKRHYRVLTFSLDETDTDAPFDAWDRYLDRLLDQTGAARVTLVGISFGGLVAARYAARHGDRLRALVLVSAPAANSKLSARQRSYVEHPLRSAIPFAVRGLRNLLPEILHARSSWPGRARLLTAHLSRVLRYPSSPRRMARWIRAWQTLPGGIDCEAIRVPTLIVTGEPELDRVVPVASTLSYLDRVAGARHVTLPGTGHIGLVCKPDAFAGVVGRFLECV